MSRKSDIISIITFVAILGITGISIIIWMSAQSWTDKTGVIVGIIFMALTVLQSGLSVTWWCVTGKKQQLFSAEEKQQQEIELEPTTT